MPPASSHSRGGGLPCARLERDGLGDEGGEREAREQRVAERAPRGDRVERAGRVDDRVRELRIPQEASVTPTRTLRRLQRGVEHRPVDAQPHVAGARRHDAAEAGAEPARHPRLERELGRHALAPRTARAPPRASAAARRRRPRHDASSSSLSSSVTSPWIADRAVVGRDPRRRAAAPRPRRARRRGTRAAPARADDVLPDRQRRDPDPAADEQRPPAVLRRAEADAQRPEQPQPVAGAQLAQPPRARADVLEQEVERAVLVAPQHRERARQERPLVGAPAPALARGEHVELARVRRAGPRRRAPR